MRQLEITGMKLTNLSYLILIISLSENILSSELEMYFEKVLESEKSIFLDCLKLEGLKNEYMIKTKCKISESSKEAFFILNKKEITKYDFLDKFVRPVPKKKVIPYYPKKAQEKGIQGYVLLKYDLGTDGKPYNIRRVEGKCGDPKTTIFFKTCLYFYNSAEIALKKFVYVPAKFDDKDIESFDNLHSFNFVLTNDYYDVRFFLEKTDDLIDEKKLDEALKIAKSSKEDIFKYQIARIYLLQEKYDEASYWFKQFLTETELGEYSPQSVTINSVIFLIKSLFYSEKYNEITALDESFDRYFKNNQDYGEALALTNFFMGAAFINQGNLNRGAYYFYRARESTSDENIIATIDQYIQKISIYL